MRKNFFSLSLHSKMLIEQAQSHTWRVVERECTATGFSHDFYVIEENLPSYPTARKTFDLMKGFEA